MSASYFEASKRMERGEMLGGAKGFLEDKYRSRGQLPARLSKERERQVRDIIEQQRFQMQDLQQDIIDLRVINDDLMQKNMRAMDLMQRYTDVMNKKEAKSDETLSKPDNEEE